MRSCDQGRYLSVGGLYTYSTGAMTDDLLHNSMLWLQVIGIDTAPSELYLSNGIPNRVDAGTDSTPDIYSRAFKDLQEIGNHVFVMHGSTCKFTNFDNHDIINAYSCNVVQGMNQVLQNPAIYAPHSWLSKVFEGPMVCEQGDCGGVNSTNSSWWSSPKGALVVDILGLPEGENGYVQAVYSEGNPANRAGGGLLLKSGRLGHQDPGPMDVKAAVVQTSDARTFRPVQAVQHVQVTSGAELHLTVTYEAAP